MKYSALRVGRGFGNNLFFRRFVVFKRLPVVIFTVLIDLLKKLFAVNLGSFGNGFLDRFFHVCVRFNMRSVNKNSLRRQASGFIYFAEYPVEHALDRFFCEPMTEVIAERREMRRSFHQRIPRKPSVRDIQADLFGSPAQR